MGAADDMQVSDGLQLSNVLAMRSLLSCCQATQALDTPVVRGKSRVRNYWEILASKKLFLIFSYL